MSLEINGYCGYFFYDFSMDLLNFSFYYWKNVTLVALKLTSIVKFHYLLILFLFDEISHKRCDTILLIDALEGLNIFAEDAFEINLVLLFGLGEFVVCPYCLPEDASIYNHILNGFLNMERNGVNVLLISDFTSIYNVSDDIGIEFFQFLRRSEVKVFDI